ncbi:unnamed protein product [Darwinula stevensoni]|uniref:EGF-like domain-containing protein n=1 Tax=Darwinula stevensoni TaxID=69355 RepID=A0A7R8XEC8_9CRUS|nr:unnamed protein product [Darwinula stevensoni]CAG0889468.1 unnamed protein product [Darwinula stevensoni]
MKIPPEKDAIWISSSRPLISSFRRDEMNPSLPAECCEGYEASPEGGCRPTCWRGCIHGSCEEPDGCKANLATVSVGPMGIRMQEGMYMQPRQEMLPGDRNLHLPARLDGIFPAFLSVRELFRSANSFRQVFLHPHFGNVLQVPMSTEPVGPELFKSLRLSQLRNLRPRQRQLHLYGRMDRTFSLFSGKDCERNCEEGSWGPDCKNRCVCLNGGTCNVLNGHCTCRPGYGGNEVCAALLPFWLPFLLRDSISRRRRELVARSEFLGFRSFPIPIRLAGRRQTLIFRRTLDFDQVSTLQPFPTVDTTLSDRTEFIQDWKKCQQLHIISKEFPDDFHPVALVPVPLRERGDLHPGRRLHLQYWMVRDAVRETRLPQPPLRTQMREAVHVRVGQHGNVRPVERLSVQARLGGFPVFHQLPARPIREELQLNVLVQK